MWVLWVGTPCSKSHHQYGGPAGIMYVHSTQVREPDPLVDETPTRGDVMRGIITCTPDSLDRTKILFSEICRPCSWYVANRVCILLTFTFLYLIIIINWMCQHVMCYFISHSLNPKKNTVSSSHHGIMDHYRCRIRLWHRQISSCALSQWRYVPSFVVWLNNPWCYIRPWRHSCCWVLRSMINDQPNLKSWMSYFVGVFYGFFPLNPVLHGAFVQQMDVAKGLSFGWCNSSSFQTLGDGVQLRSATDACDIYT